MATENTTFTLADGTQLIAEVSWRFEKGIAEWTAKIKRGGAVHMLDGRLQIAPGAEASVGNACIRAARRRVGTRRSEFG